MNEESKVVEKGQYKFGIGELGGDLPEYEEMPVEEPIKANITSVHEETSPFADEDGSHKQQFAYKLKIAEGEPGEGQVYKKWVNKPTTSSVYPNSALYQFADKVYGGIENWDNDPTSLVGKPLRIEFGKPYEGKNGRMMQKITAIKSPVKGQKELEPSDLAPADKAMAQVLGVFEGAKEAEQLNA